MSGPLHVVLEFARARDSGDPFAFRFEPGNYILRTPGGGAATITVPWGPALLAELAALRNATTDPAAHQKTGDGLRALLNPGGWARIEQDLLDALGAGRSVVVTLRSAAAELYALPWELLTLKASGAHLGELEGVLVRYEWPDTATAAHRASPAPEGGRILMAWSAAWGRVPAAEHQTAIAEACEEAGLPFDPEQHVLRHASARSLSAFLKGATEGPARERPAVLHLLCHGVGSGGVFGLGMEGDGDGEPRAIIDGARLRAILAPYADRLRAVVLCACLSGDSGELGNHLGSVAQTLHRAGIQAVVASRFPLGVEACIVFADRFYDDLVGVPASLESAFLTARDHLRARVGGTDWSSLQLYSRASDGGNTRPVVFRPYRGLLAFGPQHARFFFGRDAEGAALRERLQAAVDQTGVQFQAVVGASGSGKSSLVMAGLLGRLDPTDSGVDTVIIRPSDEGGAHRSLFLAVRGLREKLSPLRGAAAEVPDAVGRGDVLAELRKLRDAQPDRTLLITVDQLEEIFTAIDDPAVAQDFMRTVWEASNWPELRVVSMGTLRVDFIGRSGEIVLDDDGLRLDKVLYDPEHTTFVAHVAPSQINDIIQRPAERVGLRFEAGLVERILDDIGDDSSALPLLEYALDELWQRRDGALLSQAGYDSLGGFRGGLTRTADRLIAGFSSSEKTQARRLMGHLVHLGEDGGADTRKRGRLEEIRPTDPGAAADFERVVEAFVSSRLLALGEASADGSRGGWIEVAHEALIRSWRQLRDWLGEDRDMLRQSRQLRAAHDEWAATSGSERDEYLLSGGRLAFGQEVVRQFGDRLEADLVSFVDKSSAAEAGRLSRQRARLRLVVLVSTLAALIMGVLLLFALRARKEAFDAQGAAVVAQGEAEEREEEARDSEARAKEALERAREAEAEAKARADAEAEAKEIAETQTELADAARKAAEAAEFATAEKGRELRVTADNLQQSLVTQSANHAVSLSQLKGRGTESVVAALEAAQHRDDEGRIEPEATFALQQVLANVGGPTLSGHGAPVMGFAVSPDGGKLVSGDSAGGVRLWERATGASITLGPPHDAAVTELLFSPDGARAVTASDDGSVRVWDSVDGRLLRQFETGAAVKAISFSPDGERLVSSGQAPGARIWSVLQGQEAPKLTAGDPLATWRAEWSPAPGGPIATVSDSGTLRLWDPETSAQVGEGLRIGPDWLRSLVFSRDGDLLAAGNERGAILVVDVATNTEVARLEGHSANVADLAFSPDGHLLASAGFDGTARIWSLKTSALVHSLRGHSDWVRSVRFSPDGQLVLTASEDGTARIWETATGRLRKVLRGHAGAVQAARWMPDGASVATGSWDGTLRLWSAHEGGGLDHFGRPGTSLTVTTLSPDGRLLLTAGPLVPASLWSTRDGRLLARLSTTGTRMARFSPDGARLVLQGGMGQMAVFETGRGDRLAVLDDAFDDSADVVFLTSEVFATTGGRRHGLATWSALDGGLLRQLAAADDEAVHHVLALPDQGALLSAGERLVVRRAADGKMLWPGDEALLPARALKGDRVGARFAVESDSGVLVVHAAATHDRVAEIAPVEPLAFSMLDPAGGALLLAFGSGAVELRGLDGEQSVIPLRAAGSVPVTWASFSPDGARVALVDRAGSAQLVSTASGQTTGRIGAPEDPVISAHFLPAGDRLLTTRRSGVTVVHSLEASEHVRLACSWLPPDGVDEPAVSQVCALALAGVEATAEGGLAQ